VTQVFEHIRVLQFLEPRVSLHKNCFKKSCAELDVYGNDNINNKKFWEHLATPTFLKLFNMLCSKASKIYTLIIKQISYQFLHIISFRREPAVLN
jgi:hypothetical protein